MIVTNRLGAQLRTTVSRLDQDAGCEIPVPNRSADVRQIGLRVKKFFFKRLLKI